MPRRSMTRLAARLAIALLGFSLDGCASNQTSTDKQLTTDASKPGARLERRGDEIMVAGQLFHTGAPVVLWTDPGGYDAYRTDRRFATTREASFEATTRIAATRPNVSGIKSPDRYGMRTRVLKPEEREQVHGGGWPLELLQDRVDQFVLHYDVAGLSRTCFKVLHDQRGLSVHFMLDLDGTIYQTCDVKEATWHATKSNSRSVGIEIANMGAYSNVAPLAEWYETDENGQTRITIPPRLGDGGLRNKDVVLRPARNEMVAGQIHGQTLRQYDLTPEQYDSLVKLTAALCTVLPKIECDYPRDEEGNLVATTLSDEQWEAYRGVLGHYHVQRNKTDPGPAMQWDYVIDNARRLMGKPRKSASGSVKTIGIEPSTQPASQPATQPAIAGR
jgi:N-acetylmuramoyl-L-alanine amidase